ncbi:MAG: PSP1 domain-containing protein [Anaerolineae bacterium]|jgi:cell fate regulator YaaT (PSP1 superfamily)|nr:stage 0 sporulation family protein [Chloroflexota bacterium]
MPVVCSVRFRGGAKVYHFDPGELSLRTDQYVIVSTARGDEMAQVAEPPREVPETEIVGELKPILRIASPADVSRAEQFHSREAEAIVQCQERITQAQLEMKIVSAEYSYDGSRLTFYFTAENRVDFRALVRDLARTFRARIDLRQIGVRDEARLVGGLGPCGRPLCCSTWLNQFSPVSIRMAKQQNLPLSPMEISGLCGRLLCCLTYENDYYSHIRGLFPRVGRTVDTPLGPAKVIKVSVLRETVTLLFEDGSTMEMTADQLSGAEPIAAREAGVESGVLEDSLRRVTGSGDGHARHSEPRSASQGRTSEGGHARSGQQHETQHQGTQGARPRRRPSQHRGEGAHAPQQQNGGASPQHKAPAEEAATGTQAPRRSGRSRRRRRSRANASTEGNTNG